MKKIVLSIMIICLSVKSYAQMADTVCVERDVHIQAKVGYNIGGTVPAGFPAEMRSLNSYAPKFNFRAGVEAEMMFTEDYGVSTAVFLEREGFKTDVRMRHYDITLRQGGEEIFGPFSGNVVIEIVQTGITIPVQGVWRMSRNTKLRFGPYISIVADRSFQGYAYGKKIYDAEGNWTGNFDAYIRRDEIRGEKVEIGDIYTDENGNTIDKRGTFSGEEFDAYLRRFQWGIDISADCMLSERWGAYASLSYGFNSAFNNKKGNPVSMSLHPVYLSLGAVYCIK